MSFLLKNSLLFVFVFNSGGLALGQIKTDSLPKPYLAFAQNTLVYDMALSYKDYYGSGLLVMKRDGIGEYHTVFLSKVGLKLMEFTIENNQFSWVKLIDYLNKKSIRKIMERDFSMLLLADLDNPRKVKLMDKDNHTSVFKVWNNNKLEVRTYKRRVTYVENKGGANLFKTKITFNYDKENTPNSVSLTHQKLDLKFELKLLEQ